MRLRKLEDAGKWQQSSGLMRQNLAVVEGSWLPEGLEWYNYQCLQAAVRSGAGSLQVCRGSFCR